MLRKITILLRHVATCFIKNLGSVFEVVNQIDFYVVENLRSARRFLSSIKISTKIDDLTFYELGKHTQESDIPSFLNPALEGKNIGLISKQVLKPFLKFYKKLLVGPLL